VGLPEDDHVKPPKGLGFPFGGTLLFRPFEIKRSKFLAFLTRIPDLLEEVVRRIFQRCPYGAPVHATIHESKIGVKLGDTFWGMCTLINPLDWSQNSTVILQAASRADLPN
jgi:hypothetical protein